MSDESCLICGAHVSTGEALLVLKGDLRADGEFDADGTEGLLHPACVTEAYQAREAKDEPLTVTSKDFPVTFQIG